MSQVTLLVCSKTRTQQRFRASLPEASGIPGVATQALGEGQGLSAPGLTGQTEAAPRTPLPPRTPGLLHAVNLSCKSRWESWLSATESFLGLLSSHMWLLEKAGGGQAAGVQLLRKSIEDIFLSLPDIPL